MLHRSWYTGINRTVLRLNILILIIQVILLLSWLNNSSTEVSPKVNQAPVENPGPVHVVEIKSREDQKQIQSRDVKHKWDFNWDR